MELYEKYVKYKEKYYNIQNGGDSKLICFNLNDRSGFFTIIFNTNIYLC